MKKHLLSTVVSAIVIGTSAMAQCPASYTWSQSQPNVISFTNTSSPQNPNWTMYNWDFGDNQFGWSFNAQHTYSAPGTYYACLTLSDSLSQTWCTYCDTVTVTGNVLCNLYSYSQLIQMATCSTCADGSAQSWATNGTGPYTYLWSDGQTTQIANNLLPGLYTCCVTDANGCVACDSIYVPYGNSWDPLESTCRHASLSIL